MAFVASFDTLAAGPGTVTLYDASSGAAPSTAPWNWTFGSSGSSFQRNTENGVTILDTTAVMSDSAGYNLYNVSAAGGLNSATGFALDFSLQLVAENHGANHNRSGFSIIVLDSAARGIEMSFWTDEIWAKNAYAAFSHSVTESAAIDTTRAARTYRLAFQGAQFSLSVDGASTFSGALRNHAPFAAFPWNVLVYAQSNYVFFGDNTSSASANVQLSSITLTPVPEPGEWALMLAGLGCVVAAVRRRARDRRQSRP